MKGQKVKLYLKRNSATILTSIGVVGVVATSVTAVKATPKALRLLEAAKEEKGEDLTKLELVKTAGPVYIPSILIGAGTIACILGANILNKRHQAALTSAYALLDSSYKDYKKKMIELHGEDADKEVREAMAKDNYAKEDIDEEDDGKKLFYDEFSQRYYRSTTEEVLKAEYEINKVLHNSGAACLNEYYIMLGLDPIDYGEYLGWSSAQMDEMYWDSWLHFHKTKVIMDDGMECWIVDYAEPFIDFEEY